MAKVKIVYQDGVKQLPAYQTEESAGMDLCAFLENPIVLKAGEFQLVKTGISIELPSGFEAQIRPRSGLALKFGITVLNSPGTIDADYRGEIKVILINLSQEPQVIEDGDRIAQLVVQPVTRVQWDQVTDLESTERGSGGFGSTGFVG